MIPRGPLCPSARPGRARRADARPRPGPTGVRLVDVYLASLPASAPGNPRHDLAAFCRWLRAAHPPPAELALRRLTFADVDAFFVDQLRPRRGRRRDPATVYRRVAALDRFFAWAVARGALPSNPVPPEHRARGGP